MARASSDPFAHIRQATLKHRAKHGCGAYPYSNGPLLSTLAAAVSAKRILELGCALGYTSLSFAHGAPQARIECASSMNTLALCDSATESNSSSFAKSPSIE